MPRNITVTFADGSTHVYQNAPDNVTPDQVSARAARDFGKPVKSLDGGRGAAPAQPAAAPQRKVSAIQGPKPAPADPKVQAYAMERYKQARQIVVRNMAGRSPEEQQRALNRFDTDPRVQPLRQMAGMPTLQTRQQAIQEAGRKAAQKVRAPTGRRSRPGFRAACLGFPSAPRPAGFTTPGSREISTMAKPWMPFARKPTRKWKWHRKPRLSGKSAEAWSGAVSQGARSAGSAVGWRRLRFRPQPRPGTCCKPS